MLVLALLAPAIQPMAAGADSSRESGGRNSALAQPQANQPMSLAEASMLLEPPAADSAPQTAASWPDNLAELPLNDLTALVYENVWQQAGGVEQQLGQDVLDIQSLLDKTITGELKDEEQADAWTLLASKREELRVHLRVLAEHWASGQAEESAASLLSGEQQAQVQGQFEALGAQLDALLAAHQANQDVQGALEATRKLIEQMDVHILRTDETQPPAEVAPQAPQVAQAQPTGETPAIGQSMPMTEASVEALAAGESETASAAPEAGIEALPVAGDTQATLEVQLTQEIRDLATRLGNDPVAIYNYVHDSVAYASYSGSAMGATATLWAQRGNNYDQASLLIALLRAANIPAHYATGTIWLTAQQAKDWMGTRDVQSAANIISWSAPGQTTYNSSLVQFNHVWVEAYLPFAEERGGGKGWVPMDPSFKVRNYTNGPDVYGSCGDFDFNAYINLGTSGSSSNLLPFEVYADQKRSCVESAYPGQSVANAGYRGPIVANTFKRLPVTLPYIVASAGSFYSEIPDAQRVKVQVQVYAVDASGNPTTQLLAQTLTMPAIVLQRLSLVYATVSGSTIQPVLKLDGVTSVTGSNTTLGVTNYLRFTLIRPGYASDVTNYPSLKAGEHHALYVDVRQSSERLLNARKQRLLDAVQANQSAEEKMTELLHIALVRYNNRLDEARTAVDAMMRTVTPVEPRIGVTKAGTTVTLVSDLPFGVFNDKVFIDFKRNVVGTTALDSYADVNRAAAAFKLAGKSSSALEHQIWEELLKLDAMSTMKGLQWAKQKSLGPVACTTTACINGTSLSAGLKTTLNTLIGQGFTITTPTAEFSTAAGTAYQQYQGYVFQAEKVVTSPSFSASGQYVIGGGFGGGTPATSTYLIEPPRDLGFELGMVDVVLDGDPVNVASGNLVHQETDFVIPGRKLDVTWVRTYNSQSTYDGPLGYGWTHSYNMFVQVAGNGDVTVVDADGAQLVFTKSGSTYTPPAGVFDTLTKPGDYVLKQKNGTQYTFDATSLKLKSARDRNGNQATLTYSSNRLSQITDTIGRAITLAYDANNRLTTVTDFNGRTWRYAYSGNLLISYTNPLNQVTQYQYYTGQVSTQNNNNLKKVIDARTNAMTFTYYYNDKVFWHQNDLGERRSFSYNPFWKATAVLNERAMPRLFYYDTQGNLTRLVDETGAVGRYTWDTAKRLKTSQTDPLGRVTNYQYDARGNLTSLTGPLSKSIGYTYEATYNQVTSINDNGRLTQMQYFANGDLQWVKDATNAQTSFTYDSYGQVKTQTDARGKVTTYTYDPARSSFTLISVTNALSGVTAYQYDTIGRRTRVTDALGRATNIAYDSLDRVTTVTNALNGVTTTVYDAVGNVVQVTDARNNSTLFEYDKANRQTKKTDADSKITLYAYDGLGNLVQRTDPNGAVTTFAYDGANRPIQVTDAQGGVTQTAYDLAGNLVRAVDAEGRVTQNTYDALNRLVKVTNAQNNFRQIENDYWGNQTRVVDEENRATTFTYDAVNRMLSTTDATNRTTNYRYDAVGNLTQIFDAQQGLAGTPIAFVYDDLNRRTRWTDQTNKVTQYAYDALGNLTGVTLPSGAVLTMTYDQLNRLKDRTYPGGSKDILTYDAVSNMLTAQSAGGFTYTYQYDKLNRLTSLRDSRFTQAMTFAYDAMGNRVSQVDGGVGTTTYRYDLLNRPVQISDPHGDTTFFAYDRTGRRTARVLGNGTKAVYAYDTLGRLATLTNSKSNAAAISQYVYTYDKAGLVTAMTGPDGAHSYTYFANYELQRANHPGGAYEAYTYNNVGDRLTKQTQTGTTNSTYDAAHRMLTAGSTTYTYDANGNLATIASGGATTTLTWDAASRLTQVAYPAGSGKPNSQMTYDAFNQRVQLVDSRGTTRFFVDTAGNVVTEHTSAGAFQARNVFGPQVDEVVARKVGTAGTLFYHSDMLGSVTGLSDAAGNTVATYVYGAFGNTTAQSGSANNSYRYTGRELDPDSGLMYYRARYYSPDMGRFISQDSIGYDGGINLYAYVGNSPIHRVDPSGNFWDVALDIMSIGYDLYSLAKDPSWTNAGFLAADVALLFVPMVPAAGSARAIEAAASKTYSTTSNRLGRQGEAWVGERLGSSTQIGTHATSGTNPAVVSQLPLPGSRPDYVEFGWLGTTGHEVKNAGKIDKRSIDQITTTAPYFDNYTVYTRPGTKIPGEISALPNVSINTSAFRADGSLNPWFNAHGVAPLGTAHMAYDAMVRPDSAYANMPVPADLVQSRKW